MELWNDYGITSYNMADDAQRLPVDYWVLKNALAYTKPKLVIVDVLRISEDYKYRADLFPIYHAAFDFMPINATKVSAVYDLLPEGERLEFLFPLVRYHSRWSELDQVFRESGTFAPEKGANLDNSYNYDWARVSEIYFPVFIDSDEMYLDDTVGKQYLRKIIELCQAEDIDILLVSLPMIPTEEQQRWINSAQAIADEYDILYLDMKQECTFLNLNTDFHDEYHLNSSRNRKTTQVLGAYIAEQYNLPDYRDDAIAAKWNQDYVEYTNYKVEWMQAQTSLDSYFMLLADKRFDVLIEIYNGKIWKDEKYIHLMENLGVVAEELTDNTELIVVSRGGNRADVVETFRYPGTRVDTGVGQVKLTVDERGAYTVSINGEDQYTVAGDNYADMRIAVFNNATGEMVDYVSFTYNLSEPIEVQQLNTTSVMR